MPGKLSEELPQLNLNPVPRQVWNISPSADPLAGQQDLPSVGPGERLQAESIRGPVRIGT